MRDVLCVNLPATILLNMEVVFGERSSGKDNSSGKTVGVGIRGGKSYWLLQIRSDQQRR